MIERQPQEGAKAQTCLEDEPVREQGCSWIGWAGRRAQHARCITRMSADSAVPQPVAVAGAESSRGEEDTGVSV